MYFPATTFLKRKSFPQLMDQNENLISFSLKLNMIIINLDIKMERYFFDRYPVACHIWTKLWIKNIPLILCYRRNLHGSGATTVPSTSSTIRTRVRLPAFAQRNLSTTVDLGPLTWVFFRILPQLINIFEKSAQNSEKKNRR